MRGIKLESALSVINELLEAGEDLFHDLANEYNSRPSPSMRKWMEVRRLKGLVTDAALDGD